MFSFAPELCNVYLYVSYLLHMLYVIVFRNYCIDLLAISTCSQVTVDAATGKCVLISVVALSLYFKCIAY